MSANHGTRILHDDRDGTEYRVPLVAPSGTKQTVIVPNPVLGPVECVLWPFPVEARRKD